MREEIVFLHEQVARLIAQHSEVQIPQTPKASSISDRNNFPENRDDIISDSYLISKFRLSRMTTDEILNP